MQLEVLAELFVYLLLTVAITGLGLLAEIHSFLYLSGGETSVAVWLGGMGLLCLYAGVYMLGYGKLLPRARTVVDN